MKRIKALKQFGVAKVELMIPITANEIDRGFSILEIDSDLNDEILMDKIKEVFEEAGLTNVDVKIIGRFVL